MSNEVVRWEPFNEMVSLRDAVNRLFEDSFIRPGAWPLPFDGGNFSVPADVIETKDNVVVKLSAPGVKPEDIDISVVGEALTIQGELKGRRAVRRRQLHPQGAPLRRVPTDVLPADERGRRQSQSRV